MTSHSKLTSPPLKLVAIGDSLTEGVGDSRQAGGYVPFVAEGLEKKTMQKVETVNYGISGNTSQQILDRMTDKQVIQKNLKEADLMVLTAGGNDMRKVFMAHISDLSEEAFVQPQKKYGKRLATIIQTARKENPSLPIYVVGIYNPYYLNFPDTQPIFDNWNHITEEVAKAYDKVYFVPINDLLYKGIDGRGGDISEVNGKTIIKNDALYSKDQFHPNDSGYQIMATAILEKINATISDWKETNGN